MDSVEFNEKDTKKDFKEAALLLEIKEEPEETLVVTESVVIKEEKDPIELPTVKQEVNEDPLELRGEKKKRFKCDLCEKSYTRNARLQAHKRQHKNGKNQYFKCDICEKSYAHKGNLRMHKKSHVPGGLKRYKCDICEKSYSRNSLLQDHKRTHVDGKTKRFKCNICWKSYSLMKNVRLHEKSHEINGEKRIKCDTCEKSYNHSGYFDVRQLTHGNPFECDVCGKSYVQNLRERKQAHEEKRFECDICEKSYKSVKILRGHIRTHHNLVKRLGDVGREGSRTSQQVGNIRRDSFKEEPTTVTVPEMVIIEVKTEIKEEW